MKLGRQQQHQEQQRLTTTIRNKAAHFVSDLTTVLLNPISDKPSSKPPPPPGDVSSKPRRNTQECNPDENIPVLVDGPDTSSFTAFLYSFLSPGRSGSSESEFEYVASSKNENSGKKSVFFRGKQSLGRAAARFGLGEHAHASGKVKLDDRNEEMDEGVGVSMQKASSDILANISEPSQLMTQDTRTALYVALPALSQGKKWVLLYSTWRHGISLSNLYRRSNLCPGLSLLVVGDRKGAVFGGLVEAPLRPSTNKRYQGSNNTFVFTNTPGRTVIFRPTGVNRYFTLCSTEYLALGGGSHFALYLDGDLLNGSSLASETYGNSCLAQTQEFEVKEIELWGFVYASKYEETISMLRTEAPGICRW